MMGKRVVLVLMMVGLGLGKPAFGQAWRDVFDPFRVLTLNLQLDGTDWNRVRMDQPIEGSPELSETAEALFWAEGETPITVSLRRKSATDPTYPSSGDPQKFSMKIDFNAVVPGQKWRGLEKLSLEVGGDDPLKEGLVWNLHRLAANAGVYGYEAGYAAWVKVYVNGEYKGVYVNAEQKDKQSLQNRGLYKADSTWLYKVDGGRGELEVGAGNSPTFDHLCYVPFVGSRERPCAQPNLEVDLPRWVHVRGFLTLAAVEAFVSNGDGLFSHDGKNSFAADFFPPTMFRRIYFPWDQDAGKFSITENIYEHGPGAGPNEYQTKILLHPWFKQVYQQIFRDLLNGPFSVSNLTSFIDRLEVALEPDFNTDPYVYGGGAAGAFHAMRNFVAGRVPNVWTQIADPYLQAPAFNQHGGEVVSGFLLTMSALAGAIYYTTDGADPRGSGGLIAPSALLYTNALPITRTTRVRARAFDGTLWSPLDADATFNLANYATALRVTEIHYHPADESAAGDGEAYEFLELRNTGASALDVSGYFFDGIGFVFETGTIIGPGDYFVLARNSAAIAHRYPGVTVHGLYGGRLGNSGEKIRLRNSDGNTVISVFYDDDPPWPLSPNGLGYSLVNIHPDGNPDNPENWRASAQRHGSPGRADPEPSYGVGVVINEVLAHTDPPYEDAIELYNPTGNAIDIGGWFLSDDFNPTNSAASHQLKKFLIPPGTVLPAGGYAVFYETSFNTLNPRTPFALSEFGDQVYLASADAGENLNGYLVGVEFGASDQATAMGRHPTSVGVDFTALQWPTFGVTDPGGPAEFRAGTGAANAPPKVGPVVLNEIMYHPNNGGSEYIELHNIFGGDVDISNWKIEGAAFVFPTGTVMEAGSFLVLLDTNIIAADQFRTNHGLGASIPVFGHRFALQNDGESLRLEKPNDTALEPHILVDRVRFNDKSPWPTEADGEGPALERFVPELYGNDPINWRTAQLGGSPGRANLFNLGLAVVKGSTWKYQASGANLGTAWQAADYSDSSWPDGDGILGYGNPMISTVVPFGDNLTNKPVTTYFRKDFVVNDDPGSITRLLLQAWYDDGFVAYLNGTELFRSASMPTGPVTADTLAESDYNSFGYEDIDLSSAIGLLNRGANTLAVELHQASRSSEDLMWDAALSYDVQSVPTLAPPTASPGSGEFTDPIAVTLSAVPDSAEIRYTLDGPEPDQTATLYSMPIPIFASTILRARAFQPGYNESPVAIFTFTLVDNPDFDGDGLPDALDPDDDNDGIPDAWETQYGLNPTNAADALLDADQDGQDNRTEYITDTNPAASNAPFRINRLTCFKPAAIYFNSSSNRVYSLEYTLDPLGQPWMPIPGQVDVPGNGAEFFLTDTNDLPGVLYRIRVGVP